MRLWAVALLAAVLWTQDALAQDIETGAVELLPPPLVKEAAPAEEAAPAPAPTPVEAEVVVQETIAPAELAAAPAASEAPQQIWLLEGAANPTQNVTVRIEPEASYPVSDEVVFDVMIDSRFAYEDALLAFRIVDTETWVHSEGFLEIDLVPGENVARVRWDATRLPAGQFTAELVLSYAAIDDEAVFTAKLVKISASALVARLDALQEALRELALQAIPFVDGGAHPYIAMRLAIAEDWTARAVENAADGHWRALERKLRYLEKTAASVRAGMVFTRVQPEFALPRPRPMLDQVVLQDGAVYADGIPLFPFGVTAGVGDAGLLVDAAAYGLSAANILLPPAETLVGGGLDTAAAALFDAAAQEHLLTTVQLAPQRVGPALLAAVPTSMEDTDFVNLSEPEAIELYRRHVDTVLPYVAEQPMVMGLSLAFTPRFHFDGPEVRDAFLARVEALYPDRHDLNQIWRAHLADYQDIDIWSDDPLDLYQERRAYQYDWQTFHRELGLQWFVWARDLVRGYLPRTPLMATLSADAFEPFETSRGVDREEVAALMEINGCVAAISYDDPLYAVSYPDHSAYYTLMRSLAPDKPLFNMSNNILLAPELSPQRLERLVHTVCWDGAIDGLSGSFLAPASDVLEYPEATEGYAMATLDLNRLGPIVRAFQEAQAPVAVLFSESSKIIDGGVPHLESAWYAYEGCSFAGYKVRFITEEHCAAGVLDDISVLVIPETPALTDEAFEALQGYVDAGGTVIRAGTPIPYNERGISRQAVLRNTPDTILVRGMNLPTEFLHAMDAAIAEGALPPQVPRPINAYGHPLEGVKTRFVTFGGTAWLYCVNLREEPVNVHLTGGTHEGRDVIGGRDVHFPRILEPLTPMLVDLGAPMPEMVIQKQVLPEIVVAPK